MISGRQIRAARALLDMNQQELAEHAGLTPQAIRMIEDGAVQPREGTLSDIKRVFEDNGVEFTDNQGIRIKPQGVDILVGKNGLCRFFDGVYEHAKKHGGTIMQLGIDENLFWAMEEYSLIHRKRMTELVKQRNDIKVLAILCEGDTNFIASDYNEYRWIKKEIFAPVPFYIYGDNLAIMNFQTTPGPTIILHSFPAITEAYIKQFQTMWKLSREPDVPKNSTDDELTTKKRSKSRGKNVYV